jgi:hypothetical protein
MKATENILRKIGLGTTLAMALALMAWLPAQAKAADQVKGAQKLMELKPIKTAQDAEAVQPGDMIAMSCPKCKTVTVTWVETEKGHIKTERVGQKHLCPGCETTIETKGAGKLAKNEITHVCGKCGSKDAFCCVLKKSSGPTKGMEK